MDGLVWLQWADFWTHELALFAGIFFLLGALDDVAVDCVWLWLWAQGRCRPSEQLYAGTETDGTLAVFIPAWDEANVIGPMLRNTLAVWGHEDCRIYVGCYPNDPATIAAAAGAAASSDRIRLVILSRDGPTSKADCLNRLWQAMREDEQSEARQMRAVVLHDAEDVVHPRALSLIRANLAHAEFVQLPVIALPDQHSRWISGHYCDEFAEAHGKVLPVRQAVGAAIPAAGVGCAFDRACLERIARLRDGTHPHRPFAETSLTEDYELGLLVREMGGRGVFVRQRDVHGGWIATYGYFPGDLSQAVRQKGRWMMGIALMGWDRLGWTGRWAEIWMRVRDRRAILAALVLSVAYLAMLLAAVLMVGSTFGQYQPQPVSDMLATIIWVNALFLLWRAVFRFGFTTAQYGPAEGLRAVPRLVVGNIIAIMAARRALWSYFCWWRSREVVWDKTRHSFPETAMLAAFAGGTGEAAADA